MVGGEAGQQRRAWGIRLGGVVWCLAKENVCRRRQEYCRSGCVIVVNGVDVDVVAGDRGSVGESSRIDSETS